MIILQGPTFVIDSFGGLLFSICSRFAFFGFVQYLSSKPSLTHLFFDRSRERRSTALSAMDRYSVSGRFGSCGSLVIGRPSPSFIFVGKDLSIFGRGVGSTWTAIEAFFFDDCWGCGVASATRRLAVGSRPRAVNLRFSAIQSDKVVLRTAKERYYKIR